MSARPAYCSFCGKSQTEVAVMVAGGNHAFICNECVAGCSLVVRHKLTELRSAETLQTEALRCAGCVPLPLRASNLSTQELAREAPRPF